MTLKITGRHIEITPSIQQAANNAFAKLNERYGAISQSLTFDKKAGRFNVHVEFKPEHGAGVNAAATHADLYVGMRQAVSKIERQLSHAKGVEQSNRSLHISPEPEQELPLHTEAIRESVRKEEAMNQELNQEFFEDKVA